VSEAIAPTLGEYGLEMPELYIENISLPPEVEKVLDERTSMGIVGDLNKYTQFSAAKAMRDAASQGDGGMGTGLGMGMGMAMAQNMAAAMGQQGAGQGGGQQTAAAAPPPPPPPAATLWHIAENGQTRGPFAEADLQAMAQQGSLTRETLVWTEGQSGWQKAGETGALRQLFAAAPPPPPPPG